MEEIITAVNAAQPGDQMRLTVVRDGEEREVTITLGERPEQIEDSSAPALP
jgi:S1-C subfamily serine protease